MDAGLERLAGSVLCVGFDGTTSADAPLAELASLGPGGIVVFARNVETPAQTRALLDDVRSAVASSGATSPFAAIDQEGGRVARLRRGAHDVPAAMAIGAARDPGLAERIGVLLGTDVRSAGCDVDFAPVLDVAASAGTAIGDRSFGGEPPLVADLGCAVVRGIERCGVVATIKHFPGHGATRLDSHAELPVIDDDEATVRTRDLLPFVRAFAAGARAVMSAHVRMSAFDATNPATLSHHILTGLLREELKFSGVCFTDCMEMAAIAQSAGAERGAVLALAAGADCVTISHRLELALRVRAAIVRAVKHGELSLTRLEEAAFRVAGLRAVALSDLPEADEGAPLEVARRAVTVVRAAGALALREPVTVVSFEGATDDGVRNAPADAASLSLSLRRRHVRSELFRVALEPTPEMAEHLSELIVAQGARALVVLSRRADLHEAQARAIAALLAIAPQATLVSVREPFDVPLFPQARTVLCTYGDGQVSIEGLADVLVGRATPSGQLPVALAPP